MIAVATGYLALLWIPLTPEKLITIVIAIALLKFLFPNDKKTLGILKALYNSVKLKKNTKKKLKKSKKENKAEEKQLNKEKS